MTFIPILIEKCLANNEQARRTLFDQYAGLIMGVCRKYVSSSFEADDVFQETFIKIFKHLNQYDSSKGSFEGWIATIARNESLMWIRKGMKNPSVSIEDHESMGISNLPEIDNSLSVEELLSMLDQLPPGMRAIFVLHVIEGYDHNEIGKSLDISPGTSKSQLSKAKAHLIKLYERTHKIKRTI